MSQLRRIKRALISLSDKEGAIEFGRNLSEFGVKIISTGGTARTLREAGVDVSDVSEVTGFPEMMDGRVKTLHPKIHGALLGLRDNEAHIGSMRTHGIEPIDMVVVNLYPFEKTVAKEGVTLKDAVENIDIGGPAMIRSASKNWRDVAVVTDPQMYRGIIDEMRANDGGLTLETRQHLAAAAFTRTAAYDSAIANHLNGLIDTTPEKQKVESFIGNAQLPVHLSLQLAKVTDLRYGENPHQRAALYSTGQSGGIAGAEQLHGKEMSYNNYVDAEAAWDLVQDFDELAVAIIKHTNPSGVGIGENNEEAYRRALSTDPVSAFGGIVAFNRIVDAAAAKSVNEVFTEVVIAPAFEDAALDTFKSKKNLRVLRSQNSLNASAGVPSSPLAFKQISGGMLVQDKDLHQLSEGEVKVVTKKHPTAEEVQALMFAWKVCKHVKSNAIVFASSDRTLGVGAGQMNRVDSLRIAAMRAERFDLPLNGSVLASDAFFPFRDNVDEAAKLGVSAIIQPGGSIKDPESIEAADEHGIAMVFTNIRHFNH